MQTSARWLLIVATLITVGIAIQQDYRVTLKLQDPLGGHVNDFDRWMIMTPAFVQDKAGYVDDRLPTPPLTLMVLAPFTALSRPMAQFVWVCVKLPLAGLVLMLTIGIVRRSGGRLTPQAMALIVAGWWLPVVLDMQEGQTNFVALLPLVAGLYVAQEDSPAFDALAGLLIGLAIAIKVTPVVFALYFLWKGRWRVTLTAAASLAIWSLAVPGLVFGFPRNLHWLGQWVQIMIVPYVTTGRVVYAMSQSFGSFALRLLSSVPAFETARGGVNEAHYMNLFALDQAAVFRIVRAVMVGVGVAGLWWTRRRLETLRCRSYLLEIGAVAAFMLWFSERTWVHHYVSFVLTLAAAGAVLSDEAEHERTRRIVRRALLLFAAATFFTSDAGIVFGFDGVDWTKSAGVFLWASAGLTIAAMFPWQREPRRSAVAEAVPALRYWSSAILSPSPKPEE